MCVFEQTIMLTKYNVDWLRRTDLTHEWAMILCSIPSFVFSFHLAGKGVDGVFSRAGRCVFANSGAVFVRRLCSSYANGSERALLKRPAWYGKGCYWGCHSNWMWLITEYIINFKRTELNEVRSREAIEVSAESSTTNRSLRFQGIEHCKRNSQMLFHRIRTKEENAPCFIRFRNLKLNP